MRGVMTLRMNLSRYGATNGPLYSIGPNLHNTEQRSCSRMFPNWFPADAVGRSPQSPGEQVGEGSAFRLTSCKTGGWLETERSDAAVCICPDSTSSSQPQTGPVGEQTRLSEVVRGGHGAGSAFSCVLPVRLAS